MNPNLLTYALLISLLLCRAGLSAQVASSERIIERIAANLGGDAAVHDLTYLAERLSDMTENRVAINSASREELSELFFLTPWQIETLARHIERTGPVVSLYEIALLPGFDRESAELMEPFIDLTTPGMPMPRRLFTGHRVIVSSALRTTDGRADPGRYPLRSSVRYRLRSGQLTASLVAAKDQGEMPALKAGSPDFLSGGIHYSGGGVLRGITAGDFTARFGLGVTVNSGYKPFITLTGNSFTGQREGFSLYSSVNEDNYLRGIALSLRRGRSDLHLFHSLRNRDARIHHSEHAGTYAVILSTAPHHTTLSSLTAMNRLTERSSGVAFSFSHNNFRTGMVLSHTSFDLPVRADRETPTELYRFSGRDNMSGGVNYRFASGRTVMAGEVSLSQNGGAATAHTVAVRCSDRFIVNFIYRNYGRGYYSHLSGGPSRGSHTINEEGLMARASFEMARGLFLYAGSDLWRSPWLKRNSTFPSQGLNSEARIRYEYSRELYSELSIRRGYSERNSSGETGLPARGANGHTTIRMTIGARPTETISAQINLFGKENLSGERGSMLAADLEYSARNRPITVWLRQALFTTEGFGAGLYLYERDMLYGFSIPVHYGRGSRSVAVTSFRLTDNSDIRLKYAALVRHTENIMLRQSDFKMQFRWLF